MPYPTTCLHDEDIDLDAPRLCDLFLGRFALHYGSWQKDGFAALHGAWMSRTAPVGSTIGLRRGATTMRGRFAGLTEDGALAIEAFDGTLETHTAGEVLSLDAPAEERAGPPREATSLRCPD